MGLVLDSCELVFAERQELAVSVLLERASAGVFRTARGGAAKGVVVALKFRL